MNVLSVQTVHDAAEAVGRVKQQIPLQDRCRNAIETVACWLEEMAHESLSPLKEHMERYFTLTALAEGWELLHITELKDYVQAKAERLRALLAVDHADDGAEHNLRKFLFNLHSHLGALLFRERQMHQLVA